MYRMQSPQKYRQWREAVFEQHSRASVSAGSRWKAAKWLVIITLLTGAFISLATHPMLTASSFSSAAEALFPVVPYSQISSSKDTDSVLNTLTISMPQQSDGHKLPPVQPEDKMLDSNAQWQEPDHGATEHRHPVLQASQPGGSVLSIHWALEDSLLKAAELESNLASMRQENQQLSAHLLHAARQLAAVGQPVQLPQARQLEPAQNLFLRYTLVTCMLLLMLTWALWALLTAAKRFPATAQQPAAKNPDAEEVCQIVSLLLPNFAALHGTHAYKAQLITQFVDMT